MSGNKSSNLYRTQLLQKNFPGNS